MNYQDLKLALQFFGLEERATLKKIKTRYRELAKEHHPDHGEQNTPEDIRKINAAYEILSSYCENYQFCFSEEEFLEQNPEERLRRQFAWDPVWSGQQEDDS